jgi:hypothetical protein
MKLRLKHLLIPGAVRCKAQACRSPITGIAGSNLTEGVVVRPISADKCVLCVCVGGGEVI